MKRFLIVLVTLAFAMPAQSGRAELAQLPNLSALRPYFVRADYADDQAAQGTWALRFSIATANSGRYPLDVLGTFQDPMTFRASQCVSWLARVCLQRQDVGMFEFHAAHGHFHFNDFARYELRRLQDNGQPNMTIAGLVASSEKVSFCLEDTQSDTSFQLSVDDAPAYVTCLGILQGISPGWQDVYAWDLEGQQIPLRGVEDGTYALVFTANPDHLLLETTYADNQSFIHVAITNNGTEAHEVA